jgi:hypothetical protein
LRHERSPYAFNDGMYSGVIHTGDRAVVEFNIGSYVTSGVCPFFGTIAPTEPLDITQPS